MIRRTPTIGDLSRLYFQLEKIGATCVGAKKAWPYEPENREELFCLACDLSRHDPRLITILVRFLADHGNSLNPSMIRSHYPSMRTEQTVAVIAEFVLRHGVVDREQRHCLDYLQAGLEPVPLQYYFHHLYLPGGILAERAMTVPLSEYKRWGFLACEAPVLDEETRETVGQLDLMARRNVLKQLLENQKSISLSDYLAACHGSISRQQALTDLKSAGNLHLSGHGRGARWNVASRRANP